MKYHGLLPLKKCVLLLWSAVLQSASSCRRLTWIIKLPTYPGHMRSRVSRMVDCRNLQRSLARDVIDKNSRKCAKIAQMPESIQRFSAISQISLCVESSSKCIHHFQACVNYLSNFKFLKDLQHIHVYEWCNYSEPVKWPLELERLFTGTIAKLGSNALMPVKFDILFIYILLSVFHHSWIMKFPCITFNLVDCKNLFCFLLMISA